MSRRFTFGQRTSVFGRAPFAPLAVAAVLALVTANVALADKRYVWIDNDGTVRVTREDPMGGRTVQTITVPDDISWQHAPDMLAEKPDSHKLSSQELFKLAARSVYWIESRSQDYGNAPRTVYGSAVAISDELALTNCHVVGGGKAALRLGSGKTEATTEVELVAANYDADRCILKVAGMKLLPVVGIRLMSTLEVGEGVYAIGNPQGLQRSLSEGLISGIRDDPDGRLVQTTAPISPGSSGGGLFDTRGNLVGITALTLTNSQNLNFAVPAEDFWK